MEGRQGEGKRDSASSLSVFANKQLKGRTAQRTAFSAVICIDFN